MAEHRSIRSSTAYDDVDVTTMEAYLFDLRGYIVVGGAISPTQLDACNEAYDAVAAHAAAHPEQESWFSNALVHATSRQEGVHIQQCYELGAAWEELIDHPAWYSKVRHFVGSDDPENFDRHHGELFIDECLGSIRGPGGAVRLHSGGHVGAIRTQYRFHAGKFHCGQVNVLIALTDFGPGDGGTMVVPGSHKSNLRHPQTIPVELRHEERSVDDIEGAVEVHMRAGDALLFVDAIAHGSARRTNPGERRAAVYRYGPSWGFFRQPLQPSDELLARLTPRRRATVMPHPEPKRPPS